jgi:hypothetical protein
MVALHPTLGRPPDEYMRDTRQILMQHPTAAPGSSAGRATPRFWHEPGTILSGVSSLSNAPRHRRT